MSKGPERPILRFAPTPNGRLHLGHAYSALMNERAAHRFGGRLLLRMEDLDGTRCKPEFERGVLQDLAWLGVSFEGPCRRQSEHLADYANAYDSLEAKGLLYSCFCTNADIAKAWRHGRDPDGQPLYPGTCKRLTVAERERRAASGLAPTLR